MRALNKALLAVVLFTSLAGCGQQLVEFGNPAEPSTPIGGGVPGTTGVAGPLPVPGPFGPAVPVPAPALPVVDRVFTDAPPGTPGTNTVAGV